MAAEDIRGGRRTATRLPSGRTPEPLGERRRKRDGTTERSSIPARTARSAPAPHRVTPGCRPRHSVLRSGGTARVEEVGQTATKGAVGRASGTSARLSPSGHCDEDECRHADATATVRPRTSRWRAYRRCLTSRRHAMALPPSSHWGFGHSRRSTPGCEGRIVTIDR